MGTRQNLQSLAIGHLLIRDDGIELIGGKTSLRFGEASGLGHGMTILREIRRQDFAHARLIVDDKDSTHEGSGFSVYAGSVMENRIEPGWFRDNTRSPPCARAILRATARPNPVPAGFVVKKGSKIRSTASS